MEGLAASLIGTQVYDASKNTTTHKYAGKVKQKPAILSKKK